MKTVAIVAVFSIGMMGAAIACQDHPSALQVTVEDSAANWAERDNFPEKTERPPKYSSLNPDLRGEPVPVREDMQPVPPRVIDLGVTQ